MKKLGAFLFLAGLAAVLAAGCGGDDVKPVVTRLTASESCGIAPLAVEFRADASGGTPAGDPTGGNSFLHLRWNFGDGTVVENGASVAYHTFAAPDTYTVSVVASDDDGNTSPPLSRTVVVLGDTLAVEAFSAVNGELTNVVNPCQPITFWIRAHGCDFDPDTGYYERFLYTWTFEQDGGTVVYHGPRPTHSFPPEAGGDFDVHLTVEDPGLSLTRRLVIPVSVLAGTGTEVSLAGDWLDDAPVSPTYHVAQAALPETLTYALNLACAGPDNAYGVRIHTIFPINNRIVVLERRAPAGDQLEYSEEDSSGYWKRSLDWTVPVLQAGETRTLEFDLICEQIFFNTFVDFWNRIASYPCDADTTNNRVLMRLVGDA